MKKLLFINTQKQKCGVHQYGVNVFNLLCESKNLECEYSTISSLDEIKDEYDYIVINYHGLTTTKIFDPLNQLQTKAKKICLFHDLYVDFRNKIENNKFYDLFMMGDPTLKVQEPYKVFGFGRILFNFENNFIQSEIVSVGSFGFNGGDKNYYRIVELVQKEYDNAVININIPPNNATVEETIEDVRNSWNVRKIFSVVKKPGIIVNVTHDFMERDDTIKFLAKNTINIFPLNFLDYATGYGISSSLDVALSAKRPFAISKSSMFRHVLQYNLPITIEDNSIKSIVDSGIKVLEPIYKDWVRQNTLSQIEEILEK